jgi:pyruvate-formate lyase-activating enzyme
VGYPFVSTSGEAAANRDDRTALDSGKDDGQEGGHMIRLPWTSRTAPHFVLEITENCNITCRGCYKRRGDRVRSLSEVSEDLDAAFSARRVQTVSIAGAEPTLHPRLPEIVAMVRRRRARTALITNGVRLDDTLLAELKSAGLDLVMIHVDEGQQRPDLSASPTEDDINDLRLRLTRRSAAHGLDTGLAVTLYRDSLPRLSGLVRLILNSDHIHFLFATQYTNLPALFGEGHSTDDGKTTNAETVALMEEAFGLIPFAYASGRGTGRADVSLNWITYFVPVLRGAGTDILRLHSGRADAALLMLPRLISGRHLFYCGPRPRLIGVQVFLHFLGSGNPLQALAFARKAMTRGRTLDAKRLVFDNGPDLDESGRVRCLDFCPNATVRGGKLIPVCMGDYMGGG